MLESVEEETTIEKVMNPGGHQGCARFQRMIYDNNVNFSGICVSRKEEIGNVIVEIINKIGNKYGISLMDITVGKAYAKKGSDHIIDGIAFSFNNSDGDSDIKGNVYVGFLDKEEKPIYVIHTHVDMLEKLTLIELNKFSKELRQIVKDNKLKIDLKGERYNETLYGDPVIYRIGNKFGIDEFIKFLKDVEIIANKFPLCGKGNVLI